MPKNTGKHPPESTESRERAELWYAHQDPWDKEGMRLAREALWNGTPWVEGPHLVPMVPRVRSSPFPIPNRPPRKPSQRVIAEAYKMHRALTRRKRAKPGEGWGMARKQARWMDADPCVYCGGPGDSYDHIEPRKRGGTNGQDNLARACHSCNHEKLARPLLLFLAIRAQRKAAGTYRRLPGLALRGGVKRKTAP